MRIEITIHPDTVATLYYYDDLSDEDAAREHDETAEALRHKLAALVAAEWPDAGYEITTPESPARLCMVYGDVPDGVYEDRVEERVAELLDEVLNSFIS
jgi:hypothetical protein